MIVCHCNVLSSAEIKKAITEVRGKDGLGLATPNAILKHLGHRPNCGNCMPHFHRLIFEDLKATGGTPTAKTSSWSP